MPFALVTIGLLLVITGFQNTYREFGLQLAKDFTGEGNFIYWVISIGVVGILGYNKTLEPFSRAFMGLIIVVMFLSNGAFFDKLSEAVKEGTSAEPLPAGGISRDSGGGSAEGGGIGGIGDFVSGFAKGFLGGGLF